MYIKTHVKDKSESSAMTVTLVNSAPKRFTIGDIVFKIALLSVFNAVILTRNRSHHIAVMVEVSVIAPPLTRPPFVHHRRRISVSTLVPWCWDGEGEGSHLYARQTNTLWCFRVDCGTQTTRRALRGIFPVARSWYTACDRNCIYTYRTAAGAVSQ